ncbi:protein NDNF-like, partial [Gastrophryne carolinensis]
LNGLEAYAQLDSNHMSIVRSQLPIGQKVDGFVSVDRPVRYYFTLSRNQNAVTVRVTPCESPILWTLSFLTISDPLEQLDSQHKQRHKGPKILFSFKGNGEETFSPRVTSDGYYFLDLISLESDTSLQLLVWDNHNGIAPWPQLPADSQVDALSMNEEKVKLSWKASLGPDGAEIEYCVFVNKKHNFKTLCATQPNKNIGPKSHHEAEEDEPLNIITGKFKSKDNVHSKSYKNRRVPREVRYETNNIAASRNLAGSQGLCVGPSTNATIPGLKPKSLYYFDVFAVNPKDGTSAAYTGTFAETKPKHKSNILRLPDNEMVNIFLKSKSMKVIRIDPPTFQFKWLFVHSCLHKVHIQIMLNGQLLVSQSLHGAQNFKLSGNSKDNFIISLKSSKGVLGLVKLYTTSTHTTLPFQNLPTDINMSVSKRSCSSATVTWTNGGHGNKYCIYIRHIEHNLDLKLIHKHQNSCLNTSYRSRAEKVVCKQGGSQTMMEEDITDLKPGKSYLIDLYFIGLQNTTIKFPSQVLKTQEWCT